MKRFILFSIFCFVQMLTCFSYANFGRLYTSNDMSSSLIRCIIQDKYGFIWVGTNYGLNRFDGYKFSSYLCNPADTTTIQDNDIVKLYPYSKEFLFVAKIVDSINIPILPIVSSISYWKRKMRR